MTADRARALVAGLVLFLLPFAVYRPVLHGEFQVDDYRFIAWNGAHLDHLAQPWRFFTEPALVADRPEPDIYRPLRTWSFAIDRRLFGDDTLGYHVHSIVLHAIAALLAWALLRGTFANRRAGAFLGALAFAAHPLGSEAVAWISGRSDVQAAVFGLLALLAARRAEGSRRWLSLAALLAMLAGFAKETAVVVPALYLVEMRARTGRFRGSLAPFVALSVGIAGYLATYVAVRGAPPTGQVPFYFGSFARHLPFAAVGIGTFLRMVAWPTRFNFYHETELYLDSNGTGAAGLWPALVVIGVAIALAGALRRRAPSVTFGIIWFAIALAPAANLVIPLRTVVSERFAYLPLVGICGGVIIALHDALSRLSRSTRVGSVACVAICVVLGVVTTRRAAEWASQSALYEATLRDWSNSWSARLGLGSLRLAAGDRDGAESQFEAARRLVDGSRPGVPADFSRLAEATAALATSRFERGDFAGVVTLLEPIESRLAAEPAEAARARHARDLTVLLGRSLLALRKLAEALATFERALERYGESPELHDLIGNVAHLRLDGATALDQYQRALELDPDYHLARIHIAEVLHYVPGMEPEATRQLREVLARDPHQAQARELLEEWTRSK